mmetsp:Transcript_18460/g.43043  ORF Transcript_18460/g.43043 Transcript_18460/m.43043 type:complete len:228 (-) Transcript_18460:8-691(-)
MGAPSDPILPPIITAAIKEVAPRATAFIAPTPGGGGLAAFCNSRMRADSLHGASMARRLTSTDPEMRVAAAVASPRRASSCCAHTSATPPTNCCCTSSSATAITWCTAVALACTAASRAAPGGGGSARSACAACCSCSSAILCRCSDSALRLGSTTSCIAARSTASHSVARAPTCGVVGSVSLTVRTAATHRAVSRALATAAGFKPMSLSDTLRSTAVRTSAACYCI